MKKLTEVFTIKEDDGSVNPFNMSKPTSGFPSKMQTPQDVQSAWKSLETDIKTLQVGVRLIKSKFPQLDLTQELSGLDRAIADGKEKIDSAVQQSITQKRIPAPGAKPPPIPGSTGTPPPIPFGAR